MHFLFSWLIEDKCLSLARDARTGSDSNNYSSNLTRIARTRERKGSSGEILVTRRSPATVKTVLG